MPFSDVAAFIARLIVLGVDSDIIPEILVSEYGSVPNPIGAFNTVYAMMRDYLEPRPGGSYRGPGGISLRYNYHLSTEVHSS